MFCHNCGKEIRDDSVFCVYCGDKLEVETEQIASTSEKPKKSLLKTIVVIVLLLILVSSCGLSLIVFKNKHSFASKGEVVGNELGHDKENASQESVKEVVQEDKYVCVKMVDLVSGGWTTNEYDDGGNMVKISDYSAGGRVYSETKYEYDNNGNKIKSTTGDNKNTPAYFYKYEYDNNGNMIKKIAYLNSEIIHWSEYKYDSNGNEIKEISHNRDGSVYSTTEHEYDNRGNMIKSNSTGILNLLNEWEYDENGNLIKEITRQKDDGDNLVNEEKTEYEYDDNNTRIKRSVYNLYNGKTECKTYVPEYDKDGNLTKTTNYKNSEPMGWTEYDVHGNIIKDIWLRDDGSIYSTSEWEYDAHGNLVKKLVLSEDGSIMEGSEFEYKKIN